METIFSSLSFISTSPTLSKTPSFHHTNNTQQQLPNNNNLSFLSPTKKPLIISFATGGATGGRRPRVDKLKSDKFILEGQVSDTLPNGTFRILLENGEHLIANISGKIRNNFVRVQLGDRVKVEVSRYDTTVGRITYRLPNKSYVQKQQRLQQQREQEEQQKLLEREQRREKRQLKQQQPPQQQKKQGEDDDGEEDDEEVEEDEEDFEEEFEEEE